MNIVKPLRLPKKAVIGIIAPASPMRQPEKLQQGIRYLETLGYRIELGESLHHTEHGYLAGSDSIRQRDVESMFANKNISAIFCARGGYGTMRFLSTLDYSVIRKNPKIFVGFSDVTALQSAIFRKTKLVTFSGAMPGVDMHEFDAESEESFWRTLTSAKAFGTCKQSLPLQTLHIGKATGRLICGNLTLLASMCGSNYSPTYKSSILVCEDIGEESYRIDRMLCQLELAGVLKDIQALCFGQFTQESLRATTSERSVESVLQEYANRTTTPSLANIMYGHTAKKLTLPFGVQCTIDATRKTFRLDESGVC